MQASECYIFQLADIMANGKDQTARGLVFRELLGSKYTVPMSNPVPIVEGRNLGFRFAAAEPFWILSGKNTLADIAPFGKMAPYSDDGYYMSGGYGPKVVDQLSYVCRTLEKDPGSRQAVINIWRERPGPSRDIPCTLSLQFLIRDGRLHCMAVMRSSDAIMGLPYDTIFFSLCSAFVLSILRHHYGFKLDDIKLGELNVFMGSSHIYDRDFKKANDILTAWNPEKASLDFNSMSTRKPKEFLDLLEAWALDEDGGGILEMEQLL